MKNKIEVILQLRRDNEYNFEAIKNTFIPANGEVVLIDTAKNGLRAKVGDGVSTYAQLQFTDEDIRDAVLHGYLLDGNFYKTINKDGLIIPMINKIYIDDSTRKIYYYDGSVYQNIQSAFGSIVTYDKLNGNIVNGGAGIPDADQVYDFVIQKVAEVGKAINLKSATDHDDVENPAIGDFVVESDGSEWLYDGHKWREVGSENAYVLKTQKVAGIDMADDITVAELQAALGLKALAYKDIGNVKVTTIDSMKQFSTGKAGEYDVESTPVLVPESFNALDVTPAGSVKITAGTAAAATYSKTTGVTVSSAAAGEGTPNYTPSGSVTVTNVTVTPSNVSVAKVTDAGTAYQLTAGSMTQAADTKSAFATAGLVGEIGSGADAETLILTNAGTADAVTASGTVTYTNPTLSGALPTFGSESVVSGIASASATASFSGDGAIISATPTYDNAAAATVTQPTYTAAFTGTSKHVFPTIATIVRAAGTDAKVTVASENITPAFNSSEKTIGVNFVRDEIKH